MRVLDLTINENLTDWGIERTSKQKIIVMNNKSIDYDVYKIPIDLHKDVQAIITLYVVEGNTK